MPTSTEFPNHTSGKDAGAIVKTIIELAHREGWNPMASIELRCSNCQARITLTTGPFSEFDFMHMEASRLMQSIDRPLICEKCKAESFQIVIRPTQFKDWLRESLTRVTPSDQNPAVGFREDVTGKTFRDPHLRHASTFDELWVAICDHVDPFGRFNCNYSFNMIGTRYLDII